MSPRPAASLTTLVLLFLCFDPQPVSAAFPRLQLETVASGQIVSPVGIANAGDGSNRLFVVDQRGLIHILTEDEMVLPTPFLDVATKLVTERPGFDERGLLSIAFHPDFATPAAAGEGKFYIYYSAPSPDATDHTDPDGPDEEIIPTPLIPVNHMSVIAEYCVSGADPNLADPNSERILLTFNQPQFNHDGGQLGFGADGLLYISTGDGGSGDDNNAGHTGGADGARNDRPKDALGNAQDLTNLLGNILRIDVFGTDAPGGEYGIPSSNPFAATVGTEREEIFVYGLRNPWRFSFDNGIGGNGDLFVADVGQSKFEEINIIDVGAAGDAGGNYGWRIKEGTDLFDFSTLADPGGLIDPVAEYAHPGSGDGTILEVGTSVTGGFVYRGSAIPALAGKYLFADWSVGFSAPGSGTLLGMESDGNGGWDISVIDVLGGNPIPYFINAFGRDESGELYIAAKTQLAAGAVDPDSGLPTGTILRVVDGESAAISISPSRDSSIYEEKPGNSNGAGDHLFAGTTDDENVSPAAERRALLGFDIAAAIPANSTVESATLNLHVNRIPKPTVGPGIFSLHRGLADWGEGDSDGMNAGGEGFPATAGDATWTDRLFPSAQWEQPGGDFAEAASASGNSGNSTGAFSLESAAMASDVQLWSADPALNCGWFLIGGSELKSARRFSSRENTTPVTPAPTLDISFIPGPARTRHQSWRREFLPPGTFIDDNADLEHDGLANVIDYAFALDPTAFDTDGRPQLSITEEGEFQITFRRDPRATDLTYRAESSSALTTGTWSSLAESAAGAATSGTGFVSETPIPGEKPMLLVTVRDPAPFPAGGTRFLRIAIERAP